MKVIICKQSSKSCQTYFDSCGRTEIILNTHTHTHRVNVHVQLVSVCVHILVVHNCSLTKQIYVLSDYMKDFSVEYLITKIFKSCSPDSVSLFQHTTRIEYNGYFILYSIHVENRYCQHTITSWLLPSKYWQKGSIVIETIYYCCCYYCYTVITVVVIIVVACCNDVLWR